MPGVGFEPTIPVFDWAKIFRASHHATKTVMSNELNEIPHDARRFFVYIFNADT
jgi:hypothetical protein